MPFTPTTREGEVGAFAAEQNGATKRREDNKDERRKREDEDEDDENENNDDEDENGDDSEEDDKEDEVKVTTVAPVITKADSSDWKPIKPIMGGLLKVSKDEHIPWTGGKPKRG